jgi:hypothetical protein
MQTLDAGCETDVITRIPIAALAPDPKNPRKMSDVSPRAWPSR